MKNIFSSFLIASLPLMLILQSFALVVKPPTEKKEEKITTSENEALSLRGADKETTSMETESVSYTPRYGYFLQMQHTTNKCPPLSGRADVTWINGIRIGKRSPYIHDGSGTDLNLTLIGCEASKLNLNIDIETAGWQTQQHCDAVNFPLANGFQCVYNPYAYSDFSGLTELAFSSANQCQLNASPVGFITWVNGGCYNSEIRSCDPTAKTVTITSYSDSGCTADASTTIQTFSEYGIGTCDSSGIKKVCMTRAATKYVIPQLYETAVNFISSFF